MVLTELASLVTAATGLTVATSLFLGQLPETPDVCAALIEYSGLAPEATFGEPIAIERPKVQLVFRGGAHDYQAARALAEAAYQALAGVANQVVEGTRWVNVQPLQAPFFLKRDAKFRPHIAFNVLIEKEVSVA